MNGLYNKAMTCGHTKCHKKKRASVFPGREINIFLLSVSTAVYGTESREGIPIEANTLKDNIQYQVCNNFKNGSKR